jgi:lipopolysaccharide transport system permease protein
MPATEEEERAPALVITSAGRILPDLGEVWQSRHLAALFVRRNLKLRLKQSALGLLWIVLQPIAAAGVFALFFGALAGIPSDGVPYPIFVAVGLVLWQFFSRAFAEATTSLVGMSAVLSKTYLPRLIVPIAAVLTAAVDFLIALTPILLVLAASGHLPLRAAIAAPAIAFLALAAALGCSLWTSAADVLFRDARVIVGFVLQFGLFFTPVIYPIDLVPSGWRELYLLNPLAPIIGAFRWSLVATAPPPPLWSLGVAAGVLAAIFLGGLAVFARVERLLADRL